MPLLISNAILHTVSNCQEGAQFSNAELDIDSETCTEFVGKHVRRLLGNPGAREATFQAESAVYALVKAYQKGETRFRETSRQICERLASIMMENDDIPSADILVAAFENAGKQYLAILKLNYGECFTHKLIETENGPENQIIKNTAVLPLGASKVEEACLIPYDPMILRILEKPHAVNGEDVYYFSKLFLECETEISKKETAQLIQSVADEVNAKYFGGHIEADVRMKCALLEETEQSGGEDGLDLEKVARRAYPDHEEVKAEFVSLARDAGLKAEVKLDKPFVQREFKITRFKADNGVEIKCPSELFQDPESVQLQTQPDGTLTITLKNLRRQEPPQKPEG